MSKLNEIKIALPRWRPLSEAARRKTANMAANLVARLDLVTDWRLQKSYYLAEVWSIEERLRRLSDVEFASWTYGPWSLHVREAEEALEAHGLLVRVRHQAKRRPEAEFFQIPQRTKLPQLEETEVDFLDSFAAQIKYTDGATLTKI